MQRLTQKREEEAALLQAEQYIKRGKYNKVANLLEPFYTPGASNNNPLTVAMLNKAHAEKIFNYAKECAHNQEHLKVILTLEPLYKNGYKLNLEMLGLLSDAYRAEQNQNNDYRERAISLLKVLHKAADETMKTNNPDYKGALDALIGLIQCIDHKGAKAILIQEAIKIIKKNSDALLVRDSRNRPSNEYLNYASFVVYCSAALFETDEGNAATNLASQIQFFTKAKKYYVLALKFKPNDLEALLNYAKIVLIGPPQNIEGARKLLLEYSDIHKTAPSYLYSLYRVYSLLPDEARADEYYRKYEEHFQEGVNDEYVYLFRNLTGSLERMTDEPIDRISFANAKYTQKEYKEAEEIVTQLLVEYPEYMKALELSASIKLANDKYQEALTFCDRMLKIDSKSVIALEIKAKCLWCDPTGNVDQNQLVANSLCEQAFQYGSRSLALLSILIDFNFKNNNHQPLIQYALEFVKIRPTLVIYSKIAHAYLQMFQYEKALESLQKVRILDKEYEQEQISISIIYCFFQLAKTKKEYEHCAKKLSSYLSKFSDVERSPAVNLMIDQFKEMNITVRDPSYAAAENINETEEELKQNDPDAAWAVPQEIKDKIKEAMKKMSFLSDKSTKDDREDSTSEYKIDPKLLHPIGGPKSSIKAFIDPKAKLTEEQRGYFTDALEKGLVKELVNGNGRWEIAPSKVHCKYRLLSTATFFTQKPGEVILRFGGKPKTHDGVKAALR